MRKAIFALLSLALYLALAAPALAVQIDVREQGKLIKSVVFALGVDEYWVTTPDGRTVRHKMDARTFLEQKRTFVPVRYLGYALGVAEDDVGWEPNSQRVTLRLGGNILEMQIGSQTRVVNGRADEMDVAPVLRARPAWRTYLPARFVAEGLGFQVDWDGDDQLVLIWPAGQPRPEIPEQVRKEAREAREKPEAVLELENALGVVMSLSDATYTPYWRYEPSREETFQNRERSYFVVRYRTDNAYIGLDIRRATILGDIRNVELDLSPIEKVLNWKFPGQPDKVREIVDYAWQVAEKCRATGGGVRLPNKEFYVGGYKVMVGSVGGNFVSAHITRL